MKQKTILSSLFVSLALLVLMSSGAYAAQSAVNLGTAGDFVILSKAGISTTGTTAITGNIGSSPIDSTAITGFGLTMDSSNEFATSAIVTGKVYAADYASPTPTKMTTAIGDMQIAYTDAAGRTLPTATELGAGNIDGMTLAPGLYKWGTGLSIPNGVTLSGGANDVWVFQIAQDLTVGNGAIITLSGGAQAKNVFWQVAGQTTIGTTAAFKGNILSQTAIILSTGATLNGRALAQTAVTLDANAVTAPGTSPGDKETVVYVNRTMNNEGSGSNRSGFNGSSAGIPSTTWNCGEWSECSSNGTRTKTCTIPNKPDVSIEKESCAPFRILPIDTNTNNTAEPRETPAGSNENKEQENVTNDTDKNKTTGQPARIENKISWWEGVRSWFSGLFRGK